MAYNSYYPATYQPYYYPQYQQNFQQIQPQQQNFQQQVQQPVVQNNPSGIVWISSEKDAMLYPVAPNNAVALWNQNEPVVYLKQADASGKPTMKTYDLVERAETQTETAKAAPISNVNYATKEDLGAVVGVVNGIDKIIGGMKSEIESMKGDLYGIAGKKKPGTAKKTEDE